MEKTARNREIYEKALARNFDYGIMNILAQEYGLTRSRISHIVMQERRQAGKEVKEAEYTESLGVIWVQPTMADEFKVLCENRGWPRPFALRKAIEMLLFQESLDEPGGLDLP